MNVPKFFNAMCKLFGLLYALFICALLIQNGECMLRRNFESRLRICRLNCGFRGASSSGSSVQTCLVLPDQGGITVNQCVARCLERKGESLSNAMECQCRLGRCITTTEAPTTRPPTTPAPSGPVAPPNGNNNNPPPNGNNNPPPNGNNNPPPNGGNNNPPPNGGNNNPPPNGGNNNPPPNGGNNNPPPNGGNNNPPPNGGNNNPPPA